MRLAVLLVLVSGCGPVMLGTEELAQDTGNAGEAGGATDGSDASDASTPRPPDSIPTADAGTIPTVLVRIQPLDCGKCFELQAEGAGGRPPYEFEWEDGSARSRRVECVTSGERAFTVVARDSASARSAPHVIRLRPADDADCEEQPGMPPDPPPRAEFCLQNLSFEGEAAANFGQSEAFDADPWSVCTNPAVTNTPDVGNASIAQTLGPIPDPTHGDTFLALGEGEQVSQAFCNTLADDQPIYLEVDLARLNIGAGLVPDTERAFLEVWGGLSVDCSVREWLWASPPLSLGWQTYCVTLRPRSFMTQLTLRAGADGTLPTPAYLLVDNIRQVDRCP